MKGRITGLADDMAVPYYSSDQLNLMADIFYDLNSLRCRFAKHNMVGNEKTKQIFFLP